MVLDRSGKRQTLGQLWGSAMGLVWAPDGSEILFTGTPSVLRGRFMPLIFPGTNDCWRACRECFTSMTWHGWAHVIRPGYTAFGTCFRDGEAAASAIFRGSIIRI